MNECMKGMYKIGGWNCLLYTMHIVDLTNVVVITNSIRVEMGITVRTFRASTLVVQKLHHCYTYSTVAIATLKRKYFSPWYMPTASAPNSQESNVTPISTL